MLVKVSIRGKRLSKSAKEKQKAAWKAWCEEYGIQKQSSKKSRHMAVGPNISGPRVNKFGQIERY